MDRGRWSCQRVSRRHGQTIAHLQRLTSYGVSFRTSATTRRRNVPRASDGSRSAASATAYQLSAGEPHNILDMLCQHSAQRRLAFSNAITIFMPNATVITQVRVFTRRPVMLSSTIVECSLCWRATPAQVDKRRQGFSHYYIVRTEDSRRYNELIGASERFPANGDRTGGACR
jgi:hypothetical protein